MPGGRRAGGRLTHKHAAGGEVFRLHVRVPVEPQLLGLDPPLEGRQQLGHPAEETGGGRVTGYSGARTCRPEPLRKCERPGTLGAVTDPYRKATKSRTRTPSSAPRATVPIPTHARPADPTLTWLRRAAVPPPGAQRHLASSEGTDCQRGLQDQA